MSPAITLLQQQMSSSNQPVRTTNEDMIEKLTKLMEQIVISINNRPQEIKNKSRENYRNRINRPNQ
ncbi:15340_t:CDS:1, partial [Racocetra persica]